MPNQAENQEESQAKRVSTPLLSREGLGGGSFSSSSSFFHANFDLFLRTICLVAVNLFFTSAGARQGDMLLSVNTLLMTFFTLFSYVMDGFANAGEALCGKYDGSTSPQSLQAVIRHLFRWGWLMVVLFTAVYALGGRGFLGLLTDEASVVDAATEFLPWALLIPVAGMAAFVYDGIFIGLLKTRGMLVASAVATVVFFGLYFALFPVWGNHALWLALIVYLALRGLVQHLYLVESL
jgi:MATE family multidrug resistance protein